MANMTKGKSKIEQSIEALGAGQVKYAMELTSSNKTEKAHKVIVDVAKKCVSDKENCKDFCREGVEKLTDMITPTTASNEGLEEMLAEEENRAPNAPPSQDAPTAPPETPPPSDTPTVKKSDEELFAECSECNIAAAAVEFVKIAEKDECDGTEALAKLQPCVDDNMTTPEKWLKTMAEVTEKATCNKLKYAGILGGITEYLQKKDDPILKNIDKEVEHA